MKLYRVDNGFVGCSDVHIIIVAENERQALDLAREKFKKEKPYNENYWSNLEAELLCDDLTKVYVGKINE